MKMTKKEEKKFEWEKELVYKAVYLPVRFFKKEAYIHIDDYKEARDKREKVVKGLEQENKNLKEENEYRKKIADVLPEGEGHIAEETIQDLQCRIRDLTREKGNLSELNRKQSKAFGETMKDYRELLRDYMKIGEENKELKEELRYYKEKSEFQNKVIVKYQEENPMGFTDFGGYKD